MTALFPMILATAVAATVPGDGTTQGTADFTPYKLSVGMETCAGRSVNPVGVAARYAVVPVFVVGLDGWMRLEGIGERHHDSPGYAVGLGTELHPLGNGLKGPWVGLGADYQRASGSPEYDLRADLLDLRAQVGQRWMYHPGLSVGLYAGVAHRVSLGRGTAPLVGLDVGYAPMLHPPRPGYRAPERGWNPEVYVALGVGAAAVAVAAVFVSRLFVPHYDPNLE